MKNLLKQIYIHLFWECENLFSKGTSNKAAFCNGQKSETAYEKHMKCIDDGDLNLKIMKRLFLFSIFALFLMSSTFATVNADGENSGPKNNQEAQVVSHKDPNNPNCKNDEQEPEAIHCKYTYTDSSGEHQKATCWFCDCDELARGVERIIETDNSLQQ